MLVNDSMSRFNHEGYRDDTAKQAIDNVNAEITSEDADDIRCKKYVKAIKIIAELAGFDIVNRLELLDRKTGRYYR